MGGDFLSGEGRIYPKVEDRVRFVIELSRSNVRHGTGGPFGAAIFERETGRLLAPGVNLVTSLKCSVFHAEIVAIMVAQSILGDFDLGGPGRPVFELVASTEPCAMCLGATTWSGVRHLVCGAATRTPRESVSTRARSPPSGCRASNVAASPWSGTYSATRQPRYSGSTPRVGARSTTPDRDNRFHAWVVSDRPPRRRPDACNLRPKV